MSDAFPFTSIQTRSSAATLPMFREWAWDFEKDCFKRDSSGEMILLEGNEALKVWIYHLMKSERWAYLAYSDAYGVEIQPFVGHVLTVGERRSELRRVLKEALMVNPYIQSIDRVSFEENERGRVLNINVELTTVYGAITV